MMTELVSFTQAWFNFALILTLQIALVLLLREPVKNWLGAEACYRLWRLPVLWIPLYFAGPWLLDAAAPLLAAARNVDGAQTALPTLELALPVFELTVSANPAGAQGGGLQLAPLVPYAWMALGCVWFAGTLALLAWQGRRWRDFSRRISTDAEPLGFSERRQMDTTMVFNVGTPVLRVAGMNSAAVFGVVDPVLLVPDSFCQRYDQNQRHIILAHEAVHLRRGDNIWNLCGLLLLALFWINPLMFVAWRCFRLDQELSCDALALQDCSKDQQKRYARTLLTSLGTLSAYSTQPALSAWDNLGDIKERSIMIKRHLHTVTRPVTTLFSLLSLAMLGAAFTVTFAQFVSPPVEAAEPAAQALPAEQQARQVERQSRQAEQQAQQVEQLAQQVQQQQRNVEEQSRQVEQLAQQVEQQQRNVNEQSRQVGQQVRQVEQQGRQVEQQAVQVQQQARQVEQQGRQVEQQQARQVEPEARQAEQQPEDPQARNIQQAVQQPVQLAQNTQPAQRHRLMAQAPQTPSERRELDQADLNIDQQTGRILSNAIEFLNEGKFAEARARLAELNVERLSPFEKSRYHQLIFNLEMQDENYPGAREQLQLAIDSGGLNPQEQSQLRYQLAQLFIQEEKYEEGAAALEEWIANAESPSAAAHYLLAAAYYYQQKFDEALPNAQRAVELAGDVPQEGWISMLTAVYLQEQRYEDALPVLARMVELFPGKELYRNQLSGIYLQLERYEEAEIVLTKTVELFPDNPKTQKQLEDLKKLNGNTQ